MGTSDLLRLLSAPLLALLLLCGGARAEEAPPPDPKAQIPYFHLKQAYNAYRGYPSRREPERAAHELTVTVLDLSPERLARNRAFVAETGWATDFQAMFDERIAWAAPLRENPREAYRLSKEYGARAGYPGVNVEYWELGNNRDAAIGRRLHWIALDKEVPEAMMETAHAWFHREDRSMRNSALRFLGKAAAQGHHPALKEIIGRYRTGEAVRQNNPNAYYWLLRAREAGLPVDAEIAEVAALLTEKEKTEMERWSFPFPPWGHAAP